MESATGRSCVCRAPVVAGGITREFLQLVSEATLLPQSRGLEIATSGCLFCAQMVELTVSFRAVCFFHLPWGEDQGLLSP